MFRIASIALLFSGIAHIVAAVLGKFSAPTMLFGAMGVAYLVFVIGLFQRQRISAWLAFLFLLPGLAISVNGVNGPTVPNTIIYTMVLLNILTLLTLFVVLWRHGDKK